MDIVLRLPRPEVLLITRGLAILMYYSYKCQLATHDPKLSALMAELSAAVSAIANRPEAKTHRLRLDVREIAMCMFAVRSVARQLRIGDMPNLDWPAGVKQERVLAKLEKFRKRAKREWKAEGNEAAYQDWFVRWHRFMDNVGDLLRPYRCPFSLKAYHQEVVDRVFAFVKKTLLAEWLEPLPEDRELRKLVRKMMRDLRRGRCRRMTMKGILQETDDARSFVAQYMARLVAKYKYGKSLPKPKRKPARSHGEPADLFPSDTQLAQSLAIEIARMRAAADRIFAKYATPSGPDLPDQCFPAPPEGPSQLGSPD